MNPRLIEAPDRVLKPGNGPALIRWCHSNGITAPSLLHIEQERARRGLRKTNGVKK